MNKYGLIGKKLGHSFSPLLHKTFSQEMKLDFKYNLYEMEESDIGNIKKFMSENNIKGLNVTMPYKTIIMEHIDIIDSKASSINAVNTIKLQDNILHGYNTDYNGFLYLLNANNINVINKDIYILGYGGCSKAIIEVLKTLFPKKITVVSTRSVLIEDVEVISYEKLYTKSGDILINTTPVGMYPDIKASPVSRELIEKFDTLIDAIYNPTLTKFLSYGGDKTCINGMDMLVMQGLYSHKIWDNIHIDEEVIKVVKDKVIGKI